VHRPDDRSRANLLDVARTLLETEGPEALTVRRIAATAQLSTMNVYSRFGGKDGIIDELYSEGFHRLRARIAKHPKTGDPVDKTTLFHAKRASECVIANRRTASWSRGGLRGDDAAGESGSGPVPRRLAEHAGKHQPGLPHLVVSRAWCADGRRRPWRRAPTARS
jgi:AcrR family transcriptional regulator